MLLQCAGTKSRRYICLNTVSSVNSIDVVGFQAQNLGTMVIPVFHHSFYKTLIYNANGVSKDT